MENKVKIVDELIRRKFSKLRGRNTWIKGSWTVRFDENDIEIFDAPDKTGNYFLGNIRTVDIIPILDDVEKFLKQ